MNKEIEQLMYSKINKQQLDKMVNRIVQRSKDLDLENLSNNQNTWKDGISIRLSYYKPCPFIQWCIEQNRQEINDEKKDK